MFSIHTHTGESNASRGFPDSSIKIRDLVKRAKEINLSGVAITDHETVGSFIKAKNLEKEFDFPVICGNEIYLVTDSQYDALKNNYKKGMYYPHFILLAKDKIGAFQLIELSTRAWVNNSFKANGLDRTPTKFSDLEDVIGEDKGHIIATTACLGGSIPKMLLGIRDSPDRKDILTEGMETFISMCQDIFLPENFYLEVQPATEYQQDQLYVNDKIKELSTQYNIPYIIATDAHYLKKELLSVHEKFLSSKESDDREVIDFYRTAYLMSEDEVKEYFSRYWTEEEIQLGIDNTIKIGNSCERYDFDRKQVVPEVEFEEGWEDNLDHNFFPNDMEYIQKTLNSEHHQDRYLMYKIQQGFLKLIDIEDYEATFTRIEEELEEFYFISKKIGDIIGNYFITISKIIEIIWDKNGGDSLVGVGRGCFTESALVHTNNGLKQIKDVKIGDKVVTKDGSFNKVINTLIYDVEEELVQIKHLYGTDTHYPTISTSDHKILINRNGETDWLEAIKVKQGDFVCVPKMKIKESDYIKNYIDLNEFNIFNYKYDESYIYEYSPFCNNAYDYSPKQIAKELNVCKGTVERFANGHVFQNKKAKTRTFEIEFYKNYPFKTQEEYVNYIQNKRIKKINRYIKLDEDFNTFIGLMYGDGFNPKKRDTSIGLALHSNSEKDKINKEVFYKIAKRLNLEVYENKSKTKQLTQVYINSKIIREFVSQKLFVSEKGKTKEFNNEWFYQTSKNLKALLYGLSLSDGSQSESRRPSFDNTSLSLINAFKLLQLMTNDGISSLSVRPSWEDSRGYKCKESYKLRTAQSSNFTTKEDESYWYLPVKEVVILDKQSTKVYDLTIDNESNYLINNMIVHNSGVSSEIDYLLEVTEVNPIKMPVEMPFYRFMSRERAELPDIDFDTQSNRRTKIFNAVKKYFVSLGGDVVNCCTKGEYGSKSAIKTAAKGLGISNDDASVIASLVPVIRGSSLTIDQCYYGDEEKGLKPIPEFVKAMDKNEGLLETSKLIEGVYVNRGVHASGVFITNTPFTNFSAKMKSPKGIITSQWDLHESEQAGLLKYDFLTVSGLDKIRLTMDYLIANDHIEKQPTLKETYLKYFSTKILDYDHKEYWEKIHNNEVFDLFQFDSMVAMDAVSKIKPTSLVELMQTNSLMRLQQQEGAKETPVETYARFKDNPTAWDEEMGEWEIPIKERVLIKEVLDVYKGVADTQEAMMSLVRHEKLTNFDIKDAHFARKVVGKKDEKLLKPLRDKFYGNGRKYGISESTLNYLWEVQIMRQASYAFSVLHTIAYTFIALVELVLYSKYPSIYWNCACLSINAEANDESEFVDEDEEDIWSQNSEIEFDEESEDEDKKGGNTDYGKVASAIAKMQTRGVHITLPDINKSYLSFYPNEKDNLIMFGMKGIIGINDEMVHDIIDARPFKSLKDFHNRMTLAKKEVVESTGKTKQKSLVPSGKVITLIKSGAFDEIESKTRQEILKDYLLMINPPKSKLIMSNLETIINMGIVPDELSTQVRILRFKKFILDKKHIVELDTKTKSKAWYNLKRDNESLSIITETFFEEHFIISMEEGTDYRYENDGSISIFTGASSCAFDKLVDEKTQGFKDWVNSSDCLDRYNQIMFEEEWNKATDQSGNVSKWEMDSVGFYYNEHELKNINREYYGVVNYFELSDDPKIIGYNEWKGVSFPKYEITRICGTVVSRDKTKHIVTLLTPEGAVPVKYQSGQFSHYDKQVSYLDSDGSKVTLENGWFKRGNKLLICGYRINGRFKPKKYRDTIWQNTTVLIEDIEQETGKLTIKSERSRVE